MANEEVRNEGGKQMIDREPAHLVRIKIPFFFFNDLPSKHVGVETLACTLLGSQAEFASKAIVFRMLNVLTNREKIFDAKTLGGRGQLEIRNFTLLMTQLILQKKFVGDDKQKLFSI